MSFYIGVDGGGTKTAFSLFDEDKNVVKTVYGPGSNHENLEGAFDEASAVIWNGITELVGEAGISLDDVAFSLMGLAGIDHQFQHDIGIAIDTWMLPFLNDIFKYLIHIGEIEVAAQTKVLCFPVVSAHEWMNIRKATLASS